MTALLFAGIMFACVFGGALGGMYLRKSLPEHLLDRVLAHYGSDAKAARDLLKTNIANAIDQLWSRDGFPRTQLDSIEGEIILDKVQGLSPTNDAQRALYARAVNMTLDLGQTRWLLRNVTGRYPSRSSWPLLSGSA